ncbi:hypothetical protein KZ483_07275 [Paenibacillus sp. sptzw28]|uniref:hypothetical protein n=1 Tax=Paenibacillus sp. sptzw28 TaxID=715179 RepID=UPI001C6EC160|nr:hypothetical protein [Paenibacillus sp. sptzw28]QYR22739.1 hypothetical protein KZ483_07275 [Paenibacillus sp. sptzw28]
MKLLGFIGCGVISTAHLEGLEQLKRAGRETFELKGQVRGGSTITASTAPIFSRK